MNCVRRNHKFRSRNQLFSRVGYHVLLCAALIHTLAYVCVSDGAPTTQPGSLFTSSANIHSLFSVERDTAHILREFVQQQEHRLARVKDFIELIEKVNIPPSDEELVPQESFGLLHRLVRGMEIVNDALTNKDTEKVRNALSRIGLPNDGDLKGAAQAILRLQRVYDLMPFDLLPTASSEELLSVGQEAYAQGDMWSASQWFSYALSRFDSKHELRSTFLDYASYVEYRIGNLTRAIELAEELLKLDPDNKRVTLNLEYYSIAQQRSKQNENTSPCEFSNDNQVLNQTSNRDKCRRMTASPSSRYDKDNMLGHNSTDTSRFRKLCRGKRLYRSPGPLFCRLEHYGDPRLRYQPVKVEFVHHGHQRVQIFRDFAKPEECEHLKNVGTERLQRSVAWTKGSFKPVDFRISTAAWIEPDVDHVVTRLHTRIAAATQLDITHAEALQVSNYGMGGFYEPHFDHSNRRSHPDGERLATFMIYLNTVKQGGITAFPRLGVGVEPRIGDAVFWFNLQPSGMGDDLTLHGACPVVHGAKWVANKWIHERNNICRKPTKGETFASWEQNA